MLCKIINKKSGPFFSYGINEFNEEIKVLSSHLFFEKIIEVEKYDNSFYIPKKLNYDEEIINRYLDKDGLIDLNSLVEDKYVSKPYKRIYKIDDFWIFIPKNITHIVEYLYENNLVENSKIRLTKIHTTISSSAAYYSVNYEKLFHLLIEKKCSISAHYYCEHKKDFDLGVYADFYVLGNLKNNEVTFELWEIIGKEPELFYSHFIQDLDSKTFKHFDLATHIIDENSSIENLLSNKIKPKLIRKIKWFRNDSDFNKKQILDIPNNRNRN